MSGELRTSDLTSAWQRCVDALAQASELVASERRETAERARPLDNRFALSQLRCRLGPVLSGEWPEGDPFHVVVLGGTNTGKSTVMNLLLPRPLAAMRVTSRYSQFLEAFAAPDSEWYARFPERFPGYSYHRDERPERQSDADLRARGYRPVVCDFRDDELTPGVVYWDVPDFSTEEAQIYMRAVMDAAGLADLVLFCVTDESYADDRGLAVYRLLAEAGVPVLLIGNKLANDPGLCADIETKWREVAPRAGLETLWLPRVEAADADARLAGLAASEARGKLRDAVSVRAAEGATAKRVVARRLLGFLNGRLPKLLRPLAREADAARAWQLELERRAEQDLLGRYRSEYLGSVRYSEYNQTLVRLLALLDFPGIGPILRGTRKLIALPWKLVQTAVHKLWGSDERPRPPEHQVLEDLIEAWLDELRGFAQKQALATQKPAWQELCRKLGDGAFIESLYEPLLDGYSRYRAALDKEIQTRAEAMLAQLETNPTLLNALRTGNVALNLTVVALAVKSGGLDWSDAVIGPLVAGFMQLAVEYSFEAYLAAQKAALKRYQEREVRTLLETTLVEPLAGALPTLCTDAELDVVHGAWNTLQEGLRQRLEGR